MGLCLSASCSRVHENESCSEKLMILGGCNVSNGFHTRGSLCSKPGSKGVNQDAAIFCQEYGLDEGSFGGVFDGHGKNGHIVSNTVKTRLPFLLLSQRKALEKLRTLEDEEDGDSHHQIDGRSDGREKPSKNFIQWMEALLNAFKLMDMEMKLQEDFDFSCSGTTAVAIVKQGEDLVIANLGDSRAVLGRITEEGIKAIQLTTDLRPSLPKEADRITRCNGRITALKGQPERQRVWLPKEDYPGLTMSRAFGDFSLKKHGIIAIPEISYRRLSSDDRFIVLATDGVWDVLSNKQVASMVWKAGNEEAAAEAEVEAAMAAWKKRCPSPKVDDCTVLCLFLHNQR